MHLIHLGIFVNITDCLSGCPNAFLYLAPNKKWNVDVALSLIALL